jgi:hypothetical protein
MRSPGIAPTHFRNQRNVGGQATLPPTPGLRSAYTAADAAAYVEPQRKAVGVFFGPVRSTGRLWKNRPKTPEKGSCHAHPFSG